MQKWLSKLERKYGRYAISGLTNYLLICYIVGYAVSIIAPTTLEFLTLEPGYILSGQIWRLFSWIVIPPMTGFGNLIFMIFMLLLYYHLGNMLERMWGSFLYNLYMVSGILFTVLGAFIVYFVYGGVVGIGWVFSTYYINLSIFLAYACMVPDLQLYLWGLIPVRMKWLAILDAVYLLYDLVVGDLAIRICIIASLLNFILFFMGSRGMQKYNPKQMARKHNFKKEVKRPQNTYANGARHRCAVCGRTELDDPNLEFRYCSKCNGNYEYCQDHLFTHEHVK